MSGCRNPKSYTVDKRRRSAAISACDGLPTEMLERDFVRAMFATLGTLALADIIGDRCDGHITFPELWWDAHVKAPLEVLNNIANPGRLA